MSQCSRTDLCVGRRATGVSTATGFLRFYRSVFSIRIGPISSGPWAGRKCCGLSLAISREGEVLARGPYDKEALLVVEIETGNTERLERR